MESLLRPGLCLLAFALVSRFIFSLGRKPNTSTQPSPPTAQTKKLQLVKQKECQPLKELYFKLHNLESHYDTLSEAKSLLLSLFSEALRSETGAKNSILSVRRFSAASLDAFVHSELDNVTKEWRQYLTRRKQGQPRELFSTTADAHRWLVQRAPVKLVDGAWLGHVHKITTPFYLRRVTKAAWQVLSEELGDGDLTKCHAHLYAQLLDRIGVPTPEPDSEDFTQHAGMDEVTVWRSALAQLLISLFPDDFLPEILGFNLNFEMMTMETLLAAKELREVGIDPYYFTLHITIDNGDTGHTAMSSRIVADYLDLTAARCGDAAAQTAWRRVQAGFMLSKNSHEVLDAGLTTKIMDIFLAKSIASYGVHNDCPMTIGGQALSTWLEPSMFRQARWRMDFLQCLGSARPWVKKGNSNGSRLVHQLSWGGSMFGAFTDREVAVVKEWIDSLAPAGPGLYEAFTARTVTTEHDPALPNLRSWKLEALLSDSIPIEGLRKAGIVTTTPLPVDMAKLNAQRLIPVWFAQSCLLESSVSIPWNVTNDTGCSIIRLLRAQHGFLPEPVGVHGMNEMCRDDHMDLIDIGMELISRFEPGISPPESIGEVLKTWPSLFAETMMAAAARPRDLRWALLGMTQAFVRLHVTVASQKLLPETQQAALHIMASRQQESLKSCTAGLGEGGLDEAGFYKGYGLALGEIMACFGH